MAAADPLLCLALNRAACLRPKERLVLAGRLGSAEALLRLSRSDLEGLLKRRVFSRRWDPAALLAEAEADRRYLTAAGIGCTFYAERGFPRWLKEVGDSPLVLYHRGRLPDEECPWVAVVGTRHPSGAARRGAYELGFGLSRMGVVTVSGLALGIDSEAHRGSVDAGGVTVAVLGNGIDHVYPRSGEALARRILRAGGALLSEYPPGVPPLAHQFPARNRIISGLCRTVVVVEAPARSGALITADFALQEGRELFVHAAGLRGATGAGTRALFEDGAPRIGNAEELAAARGWQPCTADAAPRTAPPAGAAPISSAPPSAVVGTAPCAVADGDVAGDGTSIGRRLARLLELELAARGERKA